MDNTFAVIDVNVFAYASNDKQWQELEIEFIALLLFDQNLLESMCYLYL